MKTAKTDMTRPRDYKTFFMLNTAEYDMVHTKSLTRNSLTFPWCTAIFPWHSFLSCCCFISFPSILLDCIWNSTVLVPDCCPLLLHFYWRYLFPANPRVNHYYRIYHMYLDRQAWANSVDPDETPQNAASHLSLHCLPLIQQYLDTTSCSELYWFKF